MKSINLFLAVFFHLVALVSSQIYPPGCDAGIEWVQSSQNLTGDVEEDRYVHSFSYSSDGEILAVGADLGFGSGYVQVFKHKRNAGGLLEQLGNLIVGQSDGDKFGHSVALSADGQTLVVGAIHNSFSGYQGGSVQVYVYDDIDSMWVQRGQTLVSDDKKELAGYSVSISADGSIIAISYPKANEDSTDNGLKTGRVRMYQYDSLGEAWSQIGNDIFGVKAVDKLGDKVVLSSDGKIVAAGSKENSDSATKAGHVQIHEYNDVTEQWEQLGDAITGENENDFTGGIISLSSDGETIAIGSPWNEDNGGFRSGHVRIFTFDRASSHWIQTGTDIDGQTNDNIGSSVSLSADGLTVAISQTDTANETLTELNQYARVRVYSYDSDISDWIPLGSDVLNEIVNEYRGRSLSVELSGNGLRIAIGSSDEETSTGGLIRIYDSRDCTFPPTSFPSLVPSIVPTISFLPTVAETISKLPSNFPSNHPSMIPTYLPSISPAPSISLKPSSVPSDSPTISLVPSTSRLPSIPPSSYPSVSLLPSVVPSISHQPSEMPSISPSGPEAGPFSWKIDHLQTSRIYSGNADENVILMSSYNLSSHYHELHTFENDCETPTSAVPFVDFIPRDGFGFKEVEVSFTINQTIIESSSLWAQNDKGGSLEFCLLIELYYWKPNETKYRMNFQEIIYQMDILTVVGIDLLSFNAFRADKIDRSTPQIDYSSYVRAYQCNHDFEEISVLSLQAEGSSVAICVESTSSSLSFTTFQDLELTQSEYGPYEEGESLEAIVHGERVSDDIYVSCDETEIICYSSITLDSRFFKGAAPPPIVITGSIEMVKNRRLAISTPMSEMTILGELGEEPKVGEFQVLVEITSIDSIQTMSSAPNLVSIFTIHISLFVFGRVVFIKWL